MNRELETKPIYKSKSVISALLFLIIETLQHFGLVPGMLDHTVIEGLVDNTTGAITGDYSVADFLKYLFGLGAVYFRATAKAAVENVGKSVKEAPSRIGRWFKKIFKK